MDVRGRRRVRLFFGLRHESDLFYTDLIDRHVPCTLHAVIELVCGVG
jgi:sulfite reductase alpha subunit-like flavoprotein